MAFTNKVSKETFLSGLALSLECYLLFPFSALDIFFFNSLYFKIKTPIKQID